MSIKELREQAETALANQNWTVGDIDTEDRKVTIVVSVRLPVDLAEVLAEEAARRCASPSAVLRDLVETLRPVGQDVVVPVADLHRIIDQMARRAA